MRFTMDKNGNSKYIQTLTKRVEKVKDDFGKEVMDELQIYTPIRSGKLRKSYDMKISKNELTISNDAGYCQYVNNGTSRQRGQHFIEQSFNNAMAKLNQIIENAKKI